MRRRLAVARFWFEGNAFSPVPTTRESFLAREWGSGREALEAARGTEMVTGSIDDVRNGAGETGAAASQVLGAAQGLAQHSSSLGNEVATFLHGVKAA